MNKAASSRLCGFLVAYVGALAAMLVIFLSTMMVHYNKIDYDYLSYVVTHILAISVVPGFLGAIVCRRGNAIIFLVGVIVGPISAAVFVFLKT